MSGYYDPDGKPLTVDEWAVMFESRRKEGDDSWWRRQTTVGDASVSTVWLGLDHGWGGEPLFWETMIFGGEHSDDQWRYSSKEAALAGHDRIVKALEDGRDPTTEEAT